MPSVWLVPSMERKPKMQNTITRRATLAASVTLPLLPVAALATPDDPAVEAHKTRRTPQRAPVSSPFLTSTARNFVIGNDS
jgi:hypothetical protein